MTTRATTADRPVLGRFALPAGAIAMLFCQQMAIAGNTWDGGGGDNNWGTGANWSPDGAPGYGTISFFGTTQTTNNNDSITAMNQVNWNGSAAWVMNGSVTLSLFDFGGTQAKLESLGSGGVTINASITFAANNSSPTNPFGEINAVGSNISFTGGTLTVNGSSVNGIKFFGGNGRDVSFANTVSAAGKWFGFTSGNTQSVTIATGANVTSNDWYVMNGGTLKLAGGTLTTTAVRLGGDFGNTGNQNQTLGGTLALTPAAGGISFGSTINTVSGNSSNNLLIDSQNTSGTNTLTSGIFLDSDLKIQQAAGGTLSTSVGTFDIKGRKLTIDGAGIITIGQALTSTLSAGGMLVKQGAGTLTLSSTSNNYTGTNPATLNASGTQIAGGTLAIAGDTSLGQAPSGAYNNVQFTGSGTLRANANIGLHANRNISITSGATASFDSNGNTFTINGVINGSGGNVAKIGTGTAVFTGTNTYSGTTDVTAGTLLINGNNSGAGGAVSVSNANTRLMGTGTVGGATTINTAAIHSAGSATGAVGNQIFSSSLTYANGSIFEWDINANSTASGFDTVAVTGNLNGSTGGDTSVFRVVFGTTAKAGVNDSGNAFWNTPNASRVWSMTSLFGKNFTSGLFTSVETYDSAGVFDVSSMGSFAINGSSLTWTAVPEPTSALAGMLLTAGLLRRRRIA